MALHSRKSYVIKELWRNKIKVAHYANDFVVFGWTLENVEKADKLIMDFIKPIE